MSSQEYNEELFRKIKILNETTWDFNVQRPKIMNWLNNFVDEKEKTHALFLLSQFMYFGSLQIRELLKCLYRDLFKYPIVEDIRLANGNTKDIKLLKKLFIQSENATRFLGIGNPSESGTHLLYFFRQENKMSKSLFINTHQIFKKGPSGERQLANPNIKHYVFIDDFCGTGSQAIEYSVDIVKDIKEISKDITVSYLMLFSTKFGKDQVRNFTDFDYVETVVELDDSFKCFDVSSRYFVNKPTDIDVSYVKEMCEKYGRLLMKDICEQSGLSGSELLTAIEDSKLGFSDSQLLIGFHHNTPDNTLPIIWYDEEAISWYPVFRRYNKKYGI